MKKTKKNFTLVELLCAVGLVVILAGIGFSAYSYASHRGKEAATKSLITRLGAGLETLKTKHGFYPATSTSSINPSIFTHIEVTMPNTGIITGVRFMNGTNQISAITDTRQLKDFLAVVDAESIKRHLAQRSGDDYYLQDAWGGKIFYCYPGKYNRVKFDIIAPGADGNFTTDTTNDVTSPPNNNTDTNYKNTAGEWACDDIANFK